MFEMGIQNVQVIPSAPLLNYEIFFLFVTWIYFANYLNSIINIFTL